MVILITEICIIYEDSFGKEFFENIIKDLKNRNIINKNNKIKFVGKLILNTKLNRIIKSIMLNKNNCDKIIIEYDCDGNYDKITDKINNILGKDYKNIYLLGIKFEIEEWICDSLGIKYNNKRRPSKALNDFAKKQNNNYTKDKLPDYTGKLDYKKLNKNKSFHKFLELIK